MVPFSNRLSPLATDQIRVDHTHVLALLHRCRSGACDRERRGLVDAACQQLEVHAQLEEECCFYPALCEVGADDVTLSRSVPEHGRMRDSIAQLRASDPRHLDFDDAFMHLMREVIHHVADEETVLLPEAQRLLGPQRLADIGHEMTRRRVELMAPRAGEMMHTAARTAPAAVAVVIARTLLGAALLARRAAAR
jgi:hypothetical protein